MRDLPTSSQDTAWDYGTNLAYLKGLVEYWRDKYNWRAQEKRLNAFDQFKTTIDGVEIHFIHQRSKNPNAMPLLLLNGWPSSIVEYEKVIGPLTDPVAHGGRLEDSFHVVIPVDAWIWLLREATRNEATTPNGSRACGCS